MSAASLTGRTIELITAHRECGDKPAVQQDLMMRLVEVETKLAYMYSHARHLAGYYSDCGHGKSSGDWCQTCFEAWMTKEPR